MIGATSLESQFGFSALHFYKGRILEEDFVDPRRRLWPPSICQVDPHAFFFARSLFYLPGVCYIGGVR